MTAGTLDSSVSTVTRLRLEDRGGVAPFPARAKDTLLSPPELETDSGTRSFSCLGQTVHFFSEGKAAES